MRIAFTTKGKDWDSQMDPRFGRTDYIFLYDDESEETLIEDNTAIQNAAHGAGPQTAKKLFDLSPDILITGNGPGGNAAEVLKKSELKIYIGAGNMTVKEAYSAFKEGRLDAN
ncbi:MAG: NifB/NifX family molybdenum-iron cluster-binding protein [Spirochaetales bacterium]|nr:NifB/NifX family molybdenum-iron cluster-binding protein [Spirochaetales bacterium]